MEEKINKYSEFQKKLLEIIKHLRRIYSIINIAPTNKYPQLYWQRNRGETNFLASLRFISLALVFLYAFAMKNYRL